MCPERTAAGSELALVTGGAGFVGSHTVDRLVAEGCDVIVLDDFSTGRRENLAHWQGDERVQIVEADVAEGVAEALMPITARSGRDVTRIVHLAAQTSVVTSLAEPVRDARVNYGGTVHVLEYARQVEARSVTFASSAAVYGDTETLPVNEDEPCHPLSPYGVNKFASEAALHCYRASHGLRTTALRFFNLYGPRQDPASPYSGVISIFIERAARGLPLTVFGDGEQTRDFVYVDDAVEAIIRACLGDRASGVVNIGTGRQTSLNTLAETVRATCGNHVPILHEKARAGEIVHSLADAERAAALMDFRATTELDVGLAATAEWARNGTTPGRPPA